MEAHTRMVQRERSELLVPATAGEEYAFRRLIAEPESTLTVLSDFGASLSSRSLGSEWPGYDPHGFIIESRPDILDGVPVPSDSASYVRWVSTGDPAGAFASITRTDAGTIASRRSLTDRRRLPWGE